MRGVVATASRHATDVDVNARFPNEMLAELKAAKLLSAPIPEDLGGAGCSMRDLAVLCSTLSQACGASGMVLAMHYIQVACIVRHALHSEYFRGFLRALVDEQYLLASMTSEVGTGGDTRSSICAVEIEGSGFALKKDATTGSYCQHADGILVTCRRTPQAPANDQLLVLVNKKDYRLVQVGSWDTMGMRGTCSPGFKLDAVGAVEQIVPGSFADSSAQTMVPYSHILWSALWWGIAADAVARAAAFVRSEARKTPGTMPPGATRLAEVSAQLQSMRNNWLALATEFDDLSTGAEGYDQLQSLGWALKMNNLKINASEAAPQIVHKALQIIGVMGFKNDSKHSVSRHYRDVLSAALMISNDRIVLKSASMLLVFKDD